MITRYQFRILGKNKSYVRWTMLDFEDVKDGVKFDDAARVVFDYLVKHAQYLWPDCESVTMYGREEYMLVGKLAHHEFAAV